MSRPDKEPSWCDDDSASKITEPSGTKKLAGLLYKERPAFQYINWIFRNFVKWILHLDVSVNHFDAHEAAIPNMTVVISAGKVQNGITLTSVSEQTTSTFVAPTTNPRIDRIVTDDTTGAYSVVTGAEAASPIKPNIPDGKIANSYVTLQTTTTAITNDLITDERPSSITESLLDEDDFASDSDVYAPTQQSVKAYIAARTPVLLDTPVLLVAETVSQTITNIGHAILDSENATMAIVHARVRHVSSGPGPDSSLAILEAKNSTFTTNTAYRKFTSSQSRSTGDDLIGETYDDIEFTIGLDGNNDFWYIYTFSSVGGSTSAMEMYLIGYYK